MGKLSTRKQIIKLLGEAGLRDFKTKDELELARQLHIKMQEHDAAEARSANGQELPFKTEVAQ